MSKELIGREERWDYLIENTNTFEYQLKVEKYTKFHNFIKQKPEIWMFVACKKELIIYPANFTQEDRPTYRHIPLEKPKEENYYSSVTGKFEQYLWQNDRIEYQQAKDRCLFEGFKIIGTENFYQLEMSNGFTIVYDKRINEFVKYKTLADLCNKGIILTPRGIKDSGL